MFVRLSVPTEKLGSNWRDFHENCYSKIFRRAVENIQVSLKSEKKKSTLYESACLHNYDNISLNYENEEFFRQKL